MTPQLKNNSFSNSYRSCFTMFWRSALCWVIMGMACSVSVIQAEPPRNDYGINFYAPRDWSRQQPFLNLMLTARPWISQTDRSWDDKRPLDLDENGYVTNLKPEQQAGTILLTNPGETFPGGEYIFLYDGEGTFTWERNARLVSSEPGRQVVNVTNPPAVPGKDTFVHMKVTSVNPENYPRNMRFVKADYLEAFQQGHRLAPWVKTYWGNTEAIRYMDLTLTNHSRIDTWESRPMIGDRTYWKKGIPWEMVILMSNDLGKDAWINIPHLATDDFIRRTAEMFRDNLKPELKVYYEFSNEVWNGMFSQTRYANEQGSKTEGLGPEGWRAGLQFHALQTIRMNKILDEVYAGQPRERYVKVLGVQGGNLGAAKIVANHANVADSTDALAIAPYLTFNIPIKPSRWKPNNPVASEVETWNKDQVFEWLTANALPECMRHMDQQKALADSLGLDLIAYEGGQHLSLLGEANRNHTLSNLLAEVNRDPRMGDLYTKYLNHWTDIGGDLFCLFNAMQPYTNAGYWGLLEFVGKDPSTSPKYQAVQAWAERPKP
jgi:hypothetical protein